MQINKTYTEATQQIRKQLTKQELPSVSLPEFFTQKTYQELKQKILQTEYKHEKQPEKHSHATTQIEHPVFEELQKFLAKALGKPIKKLKPIAYRYDWKDYTLMHDNNKTTSTDIIIDFNDADEQRGGILTYVFDGIHHKIVSQENMLTIIKRKKTQRYVSYLNNHTKQPKHLILIEF